ncbi:MAG: potassium channel family protein [Candidatus Micrarchaeia archaeon]
MASSVKDLKDHVIVCGYGLVGEKIAELLQQYRISFVVIEIDKEKAEALKEKGIPVVWGDATYSKVLKEAGIERAKAIAIATDDDAKNLFILITAKSLNDKIIIATRANSEIVRNKLKEAGAGYIATPNQSASEELFRELTKGR